MGATHQSSQHRWRYSSLIVPLVLLYLLSHPIPTANPPPLAYTEVRASSPEAVVPPSSAPEAATPIPPSAMAMQPPASSPVDTRILPAATPEHTPEGTLQAEDLIYWLEQMLAPGGSISPQLAAMIHADIQRIARLGPAAVPALRAFLLDESRKDVVYGNFPGAGQLDYPSLRIALIEALGMIPGSAAEALLAELLDTDLEPAEVGLLAEILDARAADYYRESILLAAQRTLARVSRDPLANRNLSSGDRVDPAELFQVLLEHGDTTTADTLNRVLAQWQNYALVALSALPDGQGLDTLDRLARHTPDTMAGQLSLRLLTQAAVAHSGARDTLFALVSDGAIPDSLWPQLAEVVAGDHQLQLSAPDPTIQPVGSTLRSNPYSTLTVVGNGIQQLYSVHYSGVLTPMEFTLRADLLDALSAATDNPTALLSLSHARSLLFGS